MEHDEQVAFFDWVRLNREFSPKEGIRAAMSLCYAVPNGAHMTIAQRKKMVNEGMTKGILDINLDYPLRVYLPDPERSTRGGLFPGDGVIIYCGLRIEMKFNNNRLTKEQKKKKELFEKVGCFKTAVCYSAQEAIRAIFDYLPFKVEDYQGIKGVLN